jgi:four helix bundle protein
MVMRLLGFENLHVWQRSVELVSEIHRLTSRLPTEERYCLCSQMRRAAISVPANIAEGYGRDYVRDFLRHLSIAKGSLMELRTYLILVRRLGYCSEADSQRAIALNREVSRMLPSLVRTVKQQLDEGPRSKHSGTAAAD